MNWDDPAARAALIDSVGVQEYNRRFEQHLKDSEVANVGGHSIRPVGTRFGRLFQVGDTRQAFPSPADAEKYAAENPVAS